MNIYLGLRPREIFLPWVQYYSIFHAEGWNIWRASEASETFLVVVQWKTRYVYTYIYVYVIARVGVKFGINFTSVRLSGNKIARGEAECYLPLNLTRVKFVPEISRPTVLLKINTIASLLFILKCTGTLFARSPITYISYFYCLNLIASRSRQI